jgi:DNA-binding Xre family transcriptional regulator
MNHEHFEDEIEKSCAKRDAKKRMKMKVTGKSIFTLQKLIEQGKAKRIQKLSKKARS